MKPAIYVTALFAWSMAAGFAAERSADLQKWSHPAPRSGIASWYGEKHRGRLMANGKQFNPDKLTAASWFYPLGTRVRVKFVEAGVSRTVDVVITDRGPSRELVAQGRIIDLGHAAFQRLAHPTRGLVPVSVKVLSKPATARDS